MTAMPQISVIVPVYKVEPYIHRCVDSILAQTFTDFELILVDDGSPDACGAICDEYAAQDARVRVIHQANGGLSAARNAGLEVAEGKYVMFCDSDDYVDSIWCETLYKTICENEDAFIVCDVMRVSEITPIMQKWQELSLVRQSYFEVFKQGLSGFSVNKVFNRDKIEKAGLRFDESVKYAEDVPFVSAYCRQCKYCLHIPAGLYYYFCNSDSIMNRYYYNFFELQLLPFSSRLPLIADEEITEYCDIWFYEFYHYFDNVFDPRNKEMSFIQKMKFNQKMVGSDEFQFCLRHASVKQENRVLIHFLKQKQYYVFWLFQNIARIKNKVVRVVL